MWLVWTSSHHDCISWAAYMASIFSGLSMKTKQTLPVISETKPRTSPVQFLPYSIGQQASLESRPGGVDSTSQWGEEDTLAYFEEKPPPRFLGGCGEQQFQVTFWWNKINDSISTSRNNLFQKNWYLLLAGGLKTFWGIQISSCLLHWLQNLAMKNIQKEGSKLMLFCTKL